jgi:hypothetical protein
LPRRVPLRSQILRREKKLVPRKKKLTERAQQILLGSKIVEQFRERMSTAIKQDTQLLDEIKTALANPTEAAPDALASDLVAIVRTSFRRSINDATLPGREKLIKQLVGDVMEDALVEKILKD